MESGASRSDDRDADNPSNTSDIPDLRDIELWFVKRGVPHFVEAKTDGSLLDAWTRALPLLVVAYLLLGFNALLFINAEVWELAGTLTGPANIVVLFTFFALGATFALIRVAAFLGAFSGMYFTVVLTTDDTYRSEFDDVGPEIREALAVRTAYRVARGTNQSGRPATPPPGRVSN
jgi:hypothetical protein